MKPKRKSTSRRKLQTSIEGAEAAHHIRPAAQGIPHLAGVGNLPEEQKEVVFGTLAAEAVHSHVAAAGNHLVVVRIGPVEVRRIALVEEHHTGFVVVLRTDPVVEHHIGLGVRHHTMGWRQSSRPGCRTIYQWHQGEA